MRVRHKCNAVVIMVLCAGCNAVDSTIDRAMDEAGDNVSEIVAVLSAFDGKKEEAAECMVRSMLGRESVIGVGLDSIEHLYKELPRENGSWQLDSAQLARGKVFESMPRKVEYDLANISADYLIRNLEDAWQWRERQIWNRNLTEEEFCELILPYRRGDEPPTEWREAYRNEYDSLAPRINLCQGSVEAAREISRALGEIHYNIQLKTPHRSAIGLLMSPVGFCRDDCDRTLYALRAFGIPSTTDHILVSPDNGLPHQWCVVLDTEDGIYRMFDNYKFLPTRDSVHNDGRRKGKVYRETVALNLDRLGRYRKAPNSPVELLNPRLKDVTAEYFGENEAMVPVQDKTKPTYLGLFTPEGYRPIDIAENKSGRSVLFRNIEPNLIYFPITPCETSSGQYRENGMPFMVDSNGYVHSFIPDQGRMEKVKIVRKMPYWLHHEERISSIVGCRVQVGTTASGPWEDIDSVSIAPTHSFYRIPISMTAMKRYIRILPAPERRSQIGEIIATTDSLALERLPMSVITDHMTAGKKKLVDGDILTWTNYKVGNRILVFRIDSDKDVNSIFIVPRNDDNYVLPGEEYELFYYSNDGWKSLGRKVANGFDLEYDVPRNAVLWLRNLTKGREEQIFICLGGRQVFNADLVRLSYAVFQDVAAP